MRTPTSRPHTIDKGCLPINPATWCDFIQRELYKNHTTSFIYKTIFTELKLFFKGIIVFMPLVVSHSADLPLVFKNSRFCLSPFTSLMFLPFRHVSVQLLPFDHVLTVFGLFSRPFCPCFLTLSQTLPGGTHHKENYLSLYSRSHGTHAGPNISN